MWEEKAYINLLQYDDVYHLYSVSSNDDRPKKFCYFGEKRVKYRVRNSHSKKISIKNSPNTICKVSMK